MARLMVEKEKLERKFEQEMTLVKREAENKIRNIQNLYSRDGQKITYVNESPKKGYTPLVEHNKQVMSSVFDQRNDNFDEETSRGKTTRASE
jgi:hypothetical protein